MKIPHYWAWLRLKFDDSSMRMDGTPEVRGKNTTNGAPETEVFSDNIAFNQRLSGSKFTFWGIGKAWNFLCG